MTRDAAGVSRGQWLLLGAVFAASGTLGLVYQVLWMKELRLLFGSTAQATATTLTAFFLGLALGGWVGGRSAPRLRHPLFGYGVAELGIAASAILYFLLLEGYARAFPPLYRTLGNAPGVFLAVKFLLGVVLLLPAAGFMGATLPLLGEHLVRARRDLGRTGSVLYAVNTAGAVLGAYLAGFHLPLWLGYQGAYAAAIALSTVLGLLIVDQARRQPPRIPAAPSPTPDPATPGPPGPTLSWGRIRALAFLTGAVTLALEVLWTHMFAQVLHNSVYTFATVLIVFLAALALGGLLAHGLMRRGSPAPSTVALLLALGSLLVAATPNLFEFLTGGLRYIAESRDFASYQLRTLLLGLAVIFPPTLLLGAVFPYLLKLAEAHTGSVGRTLGTLIAVNTAGAILGSILAGFIVLEVLGLWLGIRLAAVAGLLGVLLPLGGWAASAPRTRGALLAAVLAVGILGGWANPPRVRVDPDRETVLGVWEGASGVTAVVQDENGLRIKVNNHYALGGSASEAVERRQGMIPLLLHPHPATVFFLGMGTGITASAAMSRPVERVTVCELVPDAVEAARTHFDPFTRGLFEDPRTRILVEDGRTFLRGTAERFDVIVSDLFVPWQAGEGTLYSRELYAVIRERLAPGGVFAQWVPLYQMSRREFEIVARTLLAVFPEVTLWRGDFSPTSPLLGFVCRTEPGSLNPEVLLGRLQEVEDPCLLLGSRAEGPPASVSPFLLAYCGALSEAPGLVGEGPVATDDRPLVEYLAPITQRRVGSNRASWFVGEELVAFLEALQTRVPPETDVYLADLPERLREYPRAGLLVQKGRALKDADRVEAAEAVESELRALLRSIEESSP